MDIETKYRIVKQIKNIRIEILMRKLLTRKELIETLIYPLKMLLI